METTLVRVRTGRVERVAVERLDGQALHHVAVQLSNVSRGVQLLRLRASSWKMRNLKSYCWLTHVLTRNERKARSGGLRR
jgi:hypothetical protein